MLTKAGLMGGLMNYDHQDQWASSKIMEAAQKYGLNLHGGLIRRTSSRFCLGVEHGDYNGTELFGVGTDRFIWMGYKPRPDRKIKLFSCNFEEEGVVEFESGRVPPPQSPIIADRWARFPWGVDYIFHREKLKIEKGMEAVIFGNIPGGGMSRSASLTLNLILSLLDVNQLELLDPFQVVEMAQAVENDYIGSPCGQLDQIMILFAQPGKGVHFQPATKKIKYIPLGEGGEALRLVILDTGTERPGLEKSTYRVRRAECEELVKLLNKDGYKINFLGEIKDKGLYDEIKERYQVDYPHLCRRLKYIFEAQQRFPRLLEAWQQGDIQTVGQIFREDGLGLRDDYQISGPELETMCDIARTVPGVLGERMLGGGDKGASGALVLEDSVEELKRAITIGYPRSHPQYADHYAVHVCRIVEGVKVIRGLLN